MLVQERPNKASATVSAVRERLLQAIDQGTPIPLAHEAEVHRAIDLLRAGEGDPEIVDRIERLSCIMRTMPDYLREGRVNAYASAVLQLRRTASSL